MPSIDIVNIKLRSTMKQPDFTHRRPKSWQKISITVPEVFSDSIASFLAALNDSAVEQSTILSTEYSAPKDVVSVYFEEDDTFTASWNQLQIFLSDLQKNNDFTYSIKTEPVVEEDWNKR
nr:hypothetical protein [Desulfobulbaceae bacterium]